MSIHCTCRSWVNETSRVLEQEHESKISAAVDRVLSSPQLDLSSLPFLALHDQYPVAAAHLQYICIPKLQYTSGGILPDLSDRHSRHLWPRRLAAAFDLIQHHREEFTISTLRKIRTEAGRTARAICGEVDWPKASRRVRAGFLLGALIGERVP